MVRLDEQGLPSLYQPFITGFAQGLDTEDGSFWGEPPAAAPPALGAWGASCQRCEHAPARSGRQSCFQSPAADPPAARVRPAAGRPCRLHQVIDGSLLISDDYVGTIYRVTYQAP